MRIWLAKVRRENKVGLIPTDEAARAILSRMGDGECCRVDLIRPRSVPWNKMYFGICRSIGENQEPPRTESSIDNELRIRAGHFEILWVDGHECRVPKRIAFDQLSADEWSELWPSLELAVRETFGQGYIREQERAA